MTNVMSLTNVRNRVSYNGFDLSEKINFTAKVGEMLPIWWHPVLAPDKMRINLKSFCRTMPLNKAAFARMRGYFDFYFVPFNQLWNKSDTVITQMLENSQSATSFDGYSWRSLSGEFPHIVLSLFPVLIMIRCMLTILNLICSRCLPIRKFILIIFVILNGSVPHLIHLMLISLRVLMI